MDTATEAKPSYIGLLNAIAEGERHAAEYLGAWASVTRNDDVRATLTTIALREAEHAAIFAKRLDELGYAVMPRPDRDHADRMACAASTTMSDREKFDELKLARAPRNGEQDIFDGFFENKDLDPVTGGLLGKYIAEERDSGRRFAACYAALPAGSAKAAKPRRKAS